MTDQPTPRTEAGPYPRDNVQEYRKTATVMAGQAPTGGVIPTLEGDHTYEAGDYIAGPGAAGEYWPVRRDIFEATYAPAAQAHTEALDVDAALGAAWRDAEALRPEGWRPIGIAAMDEDWDVYVAYTSSPQFFDGETEDDDHHASGEGLTPTDSLDALIVRLAAKADR